MARKTTGNLGTTRSKKNETSIQPAEVQGSSELSAEVLNEGVKNDFGKEFRIGKPVNTPVPINQNSIHRNSRTEGANQEALGPNLEEEIRHRAYAIYQERRANGGDSGDPRQDWLTAEREIMSRRNSRGLKSA
jgi:hypothetical protein